MGLALSKVGQITEKGVPILCMDTCSLLDIMRDPTRNSAQANDAKMVAHLLVRLERDGALVALLAEQVVTEFASHVDRIEQESQAALERLAKQIAQVDQLVAIHAMDRHAIADTKHWADHAVRTRRIAERWVASAVPVEQSDEIAAKAYRRLNQAKAPARQGKESSKDCLVIETYLEAIARLRQAGLRKNVVFLSSNIKDYTDGNAMTLRPELAAEFAALGTEYAPNFGAAKRYLGL